VDGYIIAEGNGASPRYQIRFANGGVPTAGGYCCAATPEAARSAYPGKNLAYVTPYQVMSTGETPILSGVNGYVVPDGTTGKFAVYSAVKGELTGAKSCCWDTVAAAISANSTLNLVYVSGL
jgi:hypothetical protein